MPGNNSTKIPTDATGDQTASMNAKSPTASRHAAPSSHRISEVVLAVTNLDSSLDFYQKALGLPLESREDQRAVLALDQGHKLILETSGVTAQAPRDAAGLYHVALLYKDQAALGHVLRNLTGAGYELDGAGDHKVSVALYLHDPDNNGIELYCDRPAESWPNSKEGRPNPLFTLAVDINALLKEPEPETITQPTLGHLHLVVSDMAASTDFYVNRLNLIYNNATPSAFFGTWDKYHHDLAFRIVPGVSKKWPSDRTGLRAFTLRGVSDLEMTEIRVRLDEISYAWQVIHHGISLRSPDGILIDLIS